eukprot:1161332-Pelagomonas_calceolata.AAC.12
MSIRKLQSAHVLHESEVLKLICLHVCMHALCALLPFWTAGTPLLPGLWLKRRTNECQKIKLLSLSAAWKALLASYCLPEESRASRRANARSAPLTCPDSFKACIRQEDRKN